MQVQVLKTDINYSTKDTISYLLHFFIKALFIALFSFILLILIMTFVVVGDSYYNLKNGNKVVPLIGGYIIVTPSMVPTIKVNDAVLVKRVNESDLSVGDIITFKSTDSRYDGLTVTHRVVGTQVISSGDLVYRTKGDNNQIEDLAVVEQRNIYGKVVLKLPKLGYVKDFIASPIGFFSFIIFPIAMIIYINVMNKKERKDV